MPETHLTVYFDDGTLWSGTDLTIQLEVHGVEFHEELHGPGTVVTRVLPWHRVSQVVKSVNVPQFPPPDEVGVPPH